MPETPIPSADANQPYLVVSRQDRQGKDGKPFLALVLRGRDLVDVEAKVWSSEADCFPAFAAGRVVEASCTLNVYQGRTSLVVKAALPSSLGPEAFARRTHLDVDARWDGLAARVDAMTEPLTQHVCRKLMERPGFAQAFKRAPAASKVHNNWIGGLIEHVHSLCALADGVIAHYQALYDLPVSKDKVLFGLIFHDAGKTREYDVDAPGFPPTAFGRFVPHIVMGPAWVYQASASFPGRAAMPGFELEVAHLMHILAAHHGKEEWGSPVKPASLEAVIVHHLDNLDAKVLHAREYVLGKAGDTAGFSERSWVEGTAFYQPGAASPPAGAGEADRP